MKNCTNSIVIIKVLSLIMCLVMLAGCSYILGEKVENPKLEYKAFENIGTDGLKKDISLDELQGSYIGDARFVNSNSTGEEMHCIGTVKSNRLIIELKLPGENITLDEIPTFILDEGIITGPEIEGEYLPKEEDLTLICGVKVYPSGHMISGMLKYLLPGEQVLSTIMFRITNED
ncbi:MAG: hypothetical protein ACERLG_04850 [Sedimentibacter sp.]